jgi:alkylhydroperoxidase family enzyme
MVRRGRSTISPGRTDVPCSDLTPAGDRCRRETDRMRRLGPVSAETMDPAAAAVLERFAHEDRDPISLYLALANAPGILEGINALGQCLRHRATSPRAVRELVTLRTAQLMGSEYVWAHHKPMALAAEVSERQVAELADWRSAEAFDERELAALRCADELYVGGLSDDGYDDLRRAFPPAQIVEIVITAAHYQTIARVVQALGISTEDEYRQDAP